MNRKAYNSTTELSFGQVTTELKPEPDFEDQRQALDAMLVTAHTCTASWVADFTIDPGAHDGRQEKISVGISDNGRKIAEIIQSVPTTSNFSQAMYERLQQQTLVPAVVKAARSFPGTRSGAQSGQASQQGMSGQQHLLTGQIVPDALQQVGKVSPRQLQSR